MGRRKGSKNKPKSNHSANVIGSSSNTQPANRYSVKVEETTTENNNLKMGKPEIEDVLFEETKGIESNPSFNYNPLSEPVKQRSYTQGAQPTKPVSEEEIPEPHIEKPKIDLDKVSDAIENNTENTDDSSDKSSSTKSSDNLKDLSTSEKRKAVSATANAIIAGLTRYAPMLAGNIAKFDLDELKRMSMNNQIDLNMPILEDGTRVIDYVEKSNHEAEMALVVDDKQQEEIREPLIDYLMEKQIALTAGQRLFAAVSTFVVGMGVTAYTLNKQKNAALKTFIAFHEENLNEGGTPHQKTKPVSTQEDSSDTSESVYNDITRESPLHNQSEEEDIPSRKDNDKIRIDDMTSISTEDDENVTVDEVSYEEVNKL